MTMLADEPDDLKRHALSLAQSEWGGNLSDGRLMPIADALSQFVDDGSLSCRAPGSWFVAQADARQERTAVEQIAKAGYPAYRPIVVKTEIVRHRKRTIERSMFGMYFFVRCLPTRESWHRIRMARGVRGLLVAPGGAWLKVPDLAMDVVRAVEAQHGTPDGKSRFIYHFSPGDQTRIKTGPFASFYAQLETSVDEHGRIKALVEIFGCQTHVELDADQLEAL